MSTVPDTTNFTLQDVVNAVQPSFNSLRTCMNEADDALFDPAYKGNKDRLSNFRNYGNIVIGGYGYLYNSYAINNANFTPTNWKIPLESELNILVTYLGDGYTSGGHLKEIGDNHWTNNLDADNSSKFTAYGAGARSEDGSFDDFKIQAVFWGKTTNGYCFILLENHTPYSFIYPETRRVVGYSVRLLYTGTGTPTSMTDYDGNVYDVIKIGTQYWTVQNWKCTHFNDGTALTKVTDETAWENRTTEAYCAYNNDETNV